MKVFVKATLVAILFCVVSGEPDYVLPGGAPPTSATILLTNPGRPLQPPTILSQAPQRYQRPRSKIVESYISSEFTLFGGGHPQVNQLPKRAYYRLAHPNDIPREPTQKPFEVVRAPVIYHQTVTDNDVTKALADAFDVVERLRKPGNKIKALPQDDPSPIFTNMDFVSQALGQRSQGNTATTTTTIVEAPRQLGVVRSNRHQSQAVALGQVTLVSRNPEEEEQQQNQNLAQNPAAEDIVPAPIQVVATSAPVLNAELVPVLPATTTSTSPAPAAVPPKLIIPSQPQFATLAQALQSADPQVRTIIQPVYIPYPVDQNGRPFGPLPDYQSMDFSFLLSAQKQILQAASRTVPTITNYQFVEAQPTVEASQQTLQHQQLEQQPRQQEYYVQQQQLQQVDQSEAAADNSSGTVPSTLPTRTRKRIGRRRNNRGRRVNNNRNAIN